MKRGPCGYQKYPFLCLPIIIMVILHCNKQPPHVLEHSKVKIFWDKGWGMLYMECFTSAASVCRIYDSMNHCFHCILALVFGNAWYPPQIYRSYFPSYLAFKMKCIQLRIPIIYQECTCTHTHTHIHTHTYTHTHTHTHTHTYTQNHCSRFPLSLP